MNGMKVSQDPISSLIHFLYSLFIWSLRIEDILETVIIMELERWRGIFTGSRAINKSSLYILQAERSAIPEQFSHAAF